MANGYSAVIVAVVNIFDGKPFDWAAYIGGYKEVEQETEAVDWVAKHGCKLNEEIANFIFSELSEVRYRLLGR